PPAAALPGMAHGSAAETSGEPRAGATRGSGVLGAGARVDAAAPTVQPVLHRLERHIDRRGKLGHHDVAVAPPQLEYEPPEAIRVAIARAALPTAGGLPDDPDHLRGTPADIERQV